MEMNYGAVDINAYVAKYVDEMGCSLEQACKDLGVEMSMLFNQKKDEY